MSTDAEILDILMAIRTSGLPEAQAVDAILARTGSTAGNVAVQVQGLTAARDAHHSSLLQTLSTQTTHRRSAGRCLHVGPSHCSTWCVWSTGGGGHGLRQKP
jgi:hypothetical protein